MNLLQTIFPGIAWFKRRNGSSWRCLSFIVELGVISDFADRTHTAIIF